MKYRKYFDEALAKGDLTLDASNETETEDRYITVYLLITIIQQHVNPQC